MPYTLGQKTKNNGFLKTESHKLHQAFSVATGQTIFKGQPVKMNANGEVVPAAVEEVKTNVIGFAMFGATEGQRCTVIMKSPSILFVEASDIFNCTNFITYNGYSVGTEYNLVKTANADATNSIGWALDRAVAAGDILRIATF